MASAATLPVRAILGISGLLVGTALLLCRVEGFGQPPVERGPSTIQWVRTADGWERPAHWETTSPVEQPGLHPAVVAAGQGLFSVLALVAFQRRNA